MCGVWRKRWDLNPRGVLVRSSVFRTGAIGRSATLPVQVELGEGLEPPVDASLQMRSSRRCANPAYVVKSGSGSLRSLTRIKQDSR